MGHSIDGSEIKGEIGFIEDFSLAGDREIPLKQLIPGTPEYYYYHCLHYLNQGDNNRFKQMLKQWKERHGSGDRMTGIEHRNALLEYTRNPKESLEYIRFHLGIHFKHEKELLDRKTDLPTRLDLQLIDPEKLTRNALSRYVQTSDGFEEQALPALLKRKIDPDVRRHLLKRLSRPDVDNLARMIIADLKHPYSEGFGAMNIHRNLTLSQLDQCASKMSELINQTQFVNIYLTRLHPGADIDLDKEPEEKQAHLNRLWMFVKKLDPAHNSLKAHVLYHLLAHGRKGGVYDEKLFIKYLSLPKHTVYMNQDYIEDNKYQDYCVDLSQDYLAVTLLKSVRDDIPLVNDFLQHFFLIKRGYKSFLAYIHDDYLKELFAETMILHNQGDMEEWYSMLPPSRYQALKDRVDIDFDAANQSIFRVDDQVRLGLHIKNVETLFIKVYEINALNYYCEHPKEINTDIDLDGLVPNEEMVERYDENPLHAISREFSFSKLKKRGVYIIEFIGNGKSSRALIRKGCLTPHERIGVAGHVFKVVNEKKEILKGASIRLNGHEFKSSETGEITVPFTADPGHVPMVITHDSFSCLDHFFHLSENYAFTCGMHVDREMLIRFRKAKLLLRPSLTLNQVPVTLKILEDPTLSIVSEDHNHIQTQTEIKHFEIHDHRESAHEFMVPDRLHRITFKLTAWVKMVSGNEKIKLEAEESIIVNEIDHTEITEDFHLTRFGEELVLDLLGKTGEPGKDRPVHIRLKHRDFVDEIHTTLQTDANGRVVLGELKGIESMAATGPQGKEKKWFFWKDQCLYPKEIHAMTGDTVFIPYMGRDGMVSRSEFSLIELRNDQFYKDWFESVRLEEGFFRLGGLPPGDYDCFVKPGAASFKIRVTGEKPDQDPVRSGGYIMNQTRHLGITGLKPIQIESMAADADRIRIRVAHANRNVRVHVFASRYVADDSIFQKMAAAAGSVPSRVKPLLKKSVYLSGRDIGDEYRYILERKYATRHPGNLLKRPELLLNPWAISQTETGLEEAREGEEWEASESDAREMEEPAAGPEGTPGAASGDSFTSLDFLSKGAVLMENLRPDPDGGITLNPEDLAGIPQIFVVAMDAVNTVCRRFSLAGKIEDGPRPLDLRLVNGLNPEGHYIEKSNVSLVAADETFHLENLVTSRFEIYDTLDKVFGLFMSISGSETLNEFGFILNWPEMTIERKRETYSKYACHELNFFIYQKDREFFQETVFPHIRHKKDKTFMDDYLLTCEAAAGAHVAGARDLTRYLKPWRHSGLNIVEKILLARRLKDQQGPTQRYTQDLLNFLPPDRAHDNYLYMTALKGSALDVAGDFVTAEAAEAYLGEAEASYGAPQAPKAMAKRSKAPPMAAPPVSRKESMMDTSEMAMEMLDDLGGGDFDEAEDLKKREEIRGFFRKTDQTEEFAENNYHHLPISDQNENLVTVNAFWRDFASHESGGFFSKHFPKASRNFTEMMLAVSVLDIPFKSRGVEVDYQESSLNLSTQSPLIVFHKQVMEAWETFEKSPVFVSQNFFLRNDRYEYENDIQIDKYVSDEFIVNSVYGCQVVVTNPSSRQQKLEVLIEIPQGSVPVLKSHYTQTVLLDLPAFNTQTLEYFFYFPLPGVYDHYPVHVALEGQLTAFEKPFRFNVVQKATRVDTTTWDYLSQHGGGEEVLEYLYTRNLNRISLDRIAWRMKDKTYYDRVIEVLKKRFVYNHTLWSYSIMHHDVPQLREFLRHSDGFVETAGSFIDCEIVTIDPVIRKTYQHLEYSPLINARSHRLGRRRKILNTRLHSQYLELMKVLSFRRRLDDDDLMAVTYYLLLQDRVDEALGFFNRVDKGALDTRLQYDYFRLYLAYYQGEFETVEEVADRCREYPVKRWREVFETALEHMEEIRSETEREGQGEPDLRQRGHAEYQTRLASTEPVFEFKIEAGKLIINHHMIEQVRVNYFQMDIELLFSRNPFMREDSGRFSHIRPNQTQIIDLNPGDTVHTFDLPDSFKADNIMVEVIGQGIRKSRVHYANSLNTLVIENYGQVRVLHEQEKKPIPGVYVKVYARFQDGRVRFYKDGYTDPRGRFDYASLSTDELDHVERFSILVLSDKNGAGVYEAPPPKS